MTLFKELCLVYLQSSDAVDFGGNGDPWRADGNLGVLPKRSQPPLRLYGERVAVIFDYTHHPDVHASIGVGVGGYWRME